MSGAARALVSWPRAILSAERAALGGCGPQHWIAASASAPQSVRKGPCEAVSQIEFTVFSSRSDFSFPPFFR